VIHLTVLGRPQPAGSKKAFQHPRTGRIVVTDDAKHSRPWKQQVAGAARDALIEAREGDRFAALLTGPLRVRFEFFFVRPKGHYGTGRNAHLVKASAPDFPTVKPDTTKLVRAAEDALTGVLWRDDAQIVEQTASKHYGTPERCEITVVTIDAAPVPVTRVPELFAPREEAHA
jgi:Holliday junction resolvase RusA-like endonuclease